MKKIKFKMLIILIPILFLGCTSKSSDSSSPVSNAASDDLLNALRVLSSAQVSFVPNSPESQVSDQTNSLNPRILFSTSSASSSSSPTSITCGDLTVNPEETLVGIDGKELTRSTYFNSSEHHNEETGANTMVWELFYNRISSTENENYYAQKHYDKATCELIETKMVHEESRLIEGRYQRISSLEKKYKNGELISYEIKNRSDDGVETETTYSPSDEIIEQEIEYPSGKSIGKTNIYQMHQTYKVDEDLGDNRVKTFTEVELYYPLAGFSPFNDDLRNKWNIKIDAFNCYEIQSEYSNDDLTVIHETHYPLVFHVYGQPEDRTETLFHINRINESSLEFDLIQVIEVVTEGTEGSQGSREVTLDINIDELIVRMGDDHKIDIELHQLSEDIVIPSTLYHFYGKVEFDATDSLPYNNPHGTLYVLDFRSGNIKKAGEFVFSRDMSLVIDRYLYDSNGNLQTDSDGNPRVERITSSE